MKKIHDDDFVYFFKNTCTPKFRKMQKSQLENPGIDPGTSHMLSERSTTWASPPYPEMVKLNTNIFLVVFKDCNRDFAY